MFSIPTASTDKHSESFGFDLGGKITGKNLVGNGGYFGCFTFCHRQNDQLGWVEIELQLGELEAAMQKAEAADTASYIEIVAGKHDYPEGLKLIRTRLPEMYGV